MIPRLSFGYNVRCLLFGHRPVLVVGAYYMVCARRGCRAVRRITERPPMAAPKDAA